MWFISSECPALSVLQDQSLGGWVLRKSEAEAPDIVFQIPSPCVLRAGQTLTIWAAGSATELVPRGDLVLRTHETWGPFGEVRVSLLNPQNEVISNYSSSRVSVPNS
ncbi:lamin-A-like, partial [Sinocyclocheilus rhinocerous]|uniref:lamin-A-like n=1 Tax=Sinocyclocheilus rhinocerous TaxID=307959 RepID=UPI0007B830F0